MSFSTNETTVSRMHQARSGRAALVFGLICVAACMVLLSGCGKNIPSVDTWKEHKLGGGKLGAKFPSAPKKVNQAKSVPGFGTLNVEMHQVESRRYAILSSFVKYPAVAYDVDAGLDGAVQEAARNSKSSILSTKNISKNGVKGRESYLKSPEGPLMRARVYISDKGDGPEIYQAVVVATSKSILDDENSTFFLDSLNF